MILQHFKSASFFTVIGITLFTACSSKEQTTGEGKQLENPIIVTLAKPTSNQGNKMQISGQVTAAQTAQISTRIMGYVTHLSLKVGDKVTKGQLIATISNQDLVAKRAQADAQIAEATANIKSTQKDFNRFTALYKQQSATAKELDNITLQYNTIQAKLEAAKQMRNEVDANLQYANLTAPFSGIITQKMVNEGSMATPGMPIVTIEQTDSYEISAYVPESEIALIKQGQEVDIQIASVKKTFKGSIIQINQSSQFTGGQFMIKVTIPEAEKDGLYAGLYTTMYINSAANTNATSSSLLIPLSSIERKNELTGIYTVSEHKTALLRWVRLGKTFGNQVEVLSGLSANESFIASANGQLYNGEMVSY